MIKRSLIKSDKVIKKMDRIVWSKVPRRTALGHLLSVRTNLKSKTMSHNFPSLKMPTTKLPRDLKPMLYMPTVKLLINKRRCRFSEHKMTITNRLKIKEHISVISKAKMKAFCQTRLSCKMAITKSKKDKTMSLKAAPSYLVLSEREKLAELIEDWLTSRLWSGLETSWTSHHLVHAQIRIAIYSDHDKI